MKNINQVTAFMYYIYNRWDLNEARFLFGNELGIHIFNKFNNVDSLEFYGALDKECRNKLVRRAIELYEKESNW